MRTQEMFGAAEGSKFPPKIQEKVESKKENLLRYFKNIDDTSFNYSIEREEEILDEARAIAQKLKEGKQNDFDEDERQIYDAAYSDWTAEELEMLCKEWARLIQLTKGQRVMAKLE